MGFAENVAAVKSDLSNHAMNVFVDYFTKFPQYQNDFANYKGKAPGSLKAIPAFKVHVTKVVTMLVDILQVAGNAAALKAHCQTIAKMPQHTTLKIQHYKDVGVVLIAYLQKTLGAACDTAAWQGAYNNFTSALEPLI